ncbi:M3 family oligoendopeptidase [Jeotgalibacillus terrae]|uniref:M3 family oligoendopeptidase n=1 Tax=Jeotgalibacillus terrae TaxID=587735 RepID=A0ABW5ZLR5_9BACL|nr:M3 family oligoendopeptidase [Jeotgalibacillus terrae]MBM7580948.1 pepF/M3 family oligoendopeptidase [Jeotgalibacillus terrae]
MSTATYPETWDLDVFFKGGSESDELQQHLRTYEGKIEVFAKKVEQFNTPESSDSSYLVYQHIQEAKGIMMGISQAGAFASCLEAQDMNDTGAGVVRGKVTSMAAEFGSAFQAFQQKLAKTEDQVWDSLLEDEGLKEYTFIMTEWREAAKDKLSEAEEGLISALSVDGYHGWGQMYNALVSEMSIEIEVDGEVKKLSVGQANNLRSHENPQVREEVHQKLEEAWSKNENLFAQTLNHLGGYRLAKYKKRGWDDFMKEPLEYNRMKPETLDAMWGAISKSKDVFVKYLDHKAKLLGLEKMSWAHIGAPISESVKKLSYDEGAAFILKHFKKFGPEMAAFAEKAFEEGWIEAEDRSGKRPGGFCTGFPLSEQSRIFMTYSGSMSNVATLAHELGHAFHTYALRPMDPLNRRYAMNVAETASTFAEMIVSDAAVKEADSKDEQAALLEDKVSRSIAFFMNIHSRFIFEQRFYEERKEGFVTAKRLNELTTQAQNEAYGGAVTDNEPHFWASKLHFHITGVPFYNFPYTFGYLFSLSVYARALEEGTAYEEKYMALLRDTAVMTTEELAMKHLGEDITTEAFWMKGIDLCIQDAEEFIRLTSG